MNNFHMPMMSYVFIGVTTLVLTYATIADTDNEIILTPTETDDKPSILEGFNIPSVNDAIDSVKSVSPFNENEKNIPVAVPVTPDVEEPQPLTNKNPAYGGKKKQTRGKYRKNPIKKQKTKTKRK